MIKISANNYHLYTEWAKKNTANRVFPCSITEGLQSGEIYVDDDTDTSAVFFWHYCGFGYITGKASVVFLNDIYELMASGGRRLVLITREEDVIAFFRDRENIQMDTRAEYVYPPAETDTVFMSDQESAIQNTGAAIQNQGFSIEKISAENIAGITGRIVPSFSWESADRFLMNGFGYVALEGDRICAVAFSAGISSEEVDIGVETREEYRGRGLASALAGKMCEHIMRIGKKPLWGHAGTNTGSMKTALKCGFIQTGTDTVIRVKDAGQN